jgi:cellulose synthase/poly-beta-1,6-N-acetylglucosamine synthase-like glycosyltransferase
MSVKAIYYSLFGVIAVSLFLLGLYVTGFMPHIWYGFYVAYITLALGHTWYIFALLAKEDMRPRKFATYDGEEVCVIVPCYNEEPALLKRSILSILAAKGNKRIVIINDGSTNGVEKTLVKYASVPNITVHTFEQNRGKRHGLYTGIKEYSGNAKYIVTTDSDTVFHPDAFVKMVEALKTGNIGGVSGDVQLLNEKTNWLTQMTGAYYWAALNMARRAQSAIGQVACCSGALAGYRAEVIKPLMDEFVNEEFLGKKCTYSEDRHLTNLVLRDGYDVVYRPEAIAYTSSPESLRVFLKQQLRWRRGFFQEAIVALPFMWRVKPILFFEILVWELVLPLLSVGLVLLVMLNMIIDPAFAFLVILPALLGLAVIRHLPLVFFSPDRVWGLILFSFFSQFVMFWQTLHALFTVKNKGWGTR